MASNVSLLELENNAQIGMNFLATNDFVLCGKKNLNPEQKSSIEQILQVPLVEFLCYNTELVGVFMQVDRELKIIYVPHDLYEEEVKQLEELCKEYNYTIVQISSTNNALGNLICPTQNYLIASFELKSNKKELEQKSQKKVYFLEDVDLHQAGALLYSVKGKTLASTGLRDEDLEELEEEIENITTTNSGSLYISSGIVANEKGILIGSLTTSVEIQTILEGLDYL
ncbi:MAG: hypothetical protein LAT82_02620 [Nanoarchaeota archaeon]|nr:hypothetical protein [Nanoarchaeota archaeon]